VGDHECLPVALGVLVPRLEVVSGIRAIEGERIAHDERFVDDRARPDLLESEALVGEDLPLQPRGPGLMKSDVDQWFLHGSAPDGLQ
jgi:hypothetical protein